MRGRSVTDGFVLRLEHTFSFPQVLPITSAIPVTSQRGLS